MSIRTNATTFCPPPPTWRLCHPVNIYVYQNGLEHTKPCLVHIPMEKKKNMNTVLEQIGTRMKLTVGYPVALYHMDGSRVCKTYELEMYNNYVVVTNLEKRFKCVDYGKERAPLVVIGRCSKHVNTLRLQNKRFDLFCRAKMRAKPLHELMAATGEADGLGPDQIAVQGANCGPLCNKPTKSRTERPTQCCSDEIMCVEGEFVETMDDSLNDCHLFERAMARRRMEEQRGTAAPPTTSQFTDEECKMIEELQNQVQGRSGGGQGKQSQRVGAGFDTRQCGKDGMGPLGVNQNLIDLMIRYKDVGSDIFRLFQDKIQRDKEAERMGGGARDTISARWQIPGESNLSLQTEQRVKEDLMKLAQQTCQFTFDQKGNFLFSDGCRVGEGGVSNFKFEMGTQSNNFCADVNQLPNEDTSGMLSKGEGTPGFAKRLSSDMTDSFMNSQVGLEGAPSQAQGVLEGQMNRGNNQAADSRQGYMGEEECDEMDEDCEQMQRERRVPSKPLSQQGMDKGSGTLDSNGRRVSNMQSEISQIVGNVRRNSRSNSFKGGRLNQQNSQTLETLVEEEEDEGTGEWGRRQVNASGSAQIKTSNSRGQMNGGRGTGGYEEEDEEDDFVEIKGMSSSMISNINRMDGDEGEEGMIRRGLSGGFVTGSKSNNSNPSGGGWNSGGNYNEGTVTKDLSGGYINGSKSNISGGGWNSGGNYNEGTVTKDLNGGYINGSKSNISGGGWNSGGNYNEGTVTKDLSGGYINGSKSNISGGGWNSGGNYNEGTVTRDLSGGYTNGSKSNINGGGWNNGENYNEGTVTRDLSGGYTNGSKSNINGGGWNNGGDDNEEMVSRGPSGGFVTGSKSKNSNKSNTSVGRNNRGNGEQEMMRRDPSGGNLKNNRSNTSNLSEERRNKNRGRNNDYDEDEDEDGGGRTNVFSVLTEFRNPFKEGLVPSLAGKLHKDRLDKLFAENPFRQHYFHGDETKKRHGGGKANELIFLRKNEFTPLACSTISLPPPPETESPPILSSRGFKTEYLLQQRPDVFLQQINELVHRHDNTKATSPPPPLPPGMSDSRNIFTIGPGSPRSSRVKLRKGKKTMNAACGPNTTEIRRGVSAQLMAEVDKAINDDTWEIKPSRRKPKCFEGGTQTPRQLKPLKELPSEDEKPAGIYEGYQESIKLKDTSIDGEIIFSDNDGDDERKIRYRKRKENRRLMRKRKEYYLHPVEVDENENMNDDDDEDNNPFVYVSANQHGTQHQQPQIRYISQAHPYLSPSQHQQQQQPFFVQTSAATPTALPLLTRHSTQAAPGRFAGLVNSSQQPLQFPIQIMRSQQQQLTGGNGNPVSARLLLPMTNNMIPSSSNLVRQPIIFTTGQAQQSSSLVPDRSKFLPVIPQNSPQNTSMRLIRIVAPNTHQQMIPSQGGVLQNKLIQMYQPVFPAPQILRPQQQQQSSPQSQPPQQFILK